LVDAKTKPRINPMKLTDKISWLMGRVQRSLFPHLDECFDTLLTEQEQRLVTMLEIVQVERYVSKKSTTQRLGRKLLVREALARAFVAKAVYRLPTTSDLIRAIRATSNLRRICGFIAMGEIPSESTFSRAFTEFADSGLGNRAHDALVQDYLAGELIGHISRDSTAIVGREKPTQKVKKPKMPRKRGRPAKGEQREPVVEKRLDRQVGQSAAEAIRELPFACDRGTKKNAKGYKTSWNGYKLHLDINDVGLPISAYDARLINETSRQFEHVPIIDKNSRGREVIPMAPHEAERYKVRTSVEQANGRLKEDFGADNVMVKGHSKVNQHLMFGVIVLFADQLIRLLV
jgi:hypothetical protein